MLHKFLNWLFPSKAKEVSIFSVHTSVKKVFFLAVELPDLRATCHSVTMFLPDLREVLDLQVDRVGFNTEYTAWLSLTDKTAWIALEPTDKLIVTTVTEHVHTY